MIAVIDYGLGNLRSVSKALEKVGAGVKVTSAGREISLADAIVLPGVGAFYYGMKHLKELGIIPAIVDSINKGRPFLGICLGLQFLFTETEEYGLHKGLDIIKGRVKKIPNTGSIKIPHMGWNQVRFTSLQAASWSKGTIFDGVPDNSYFYFVHSYYVKPENRDVIAATTNYAVEFASAVVRDNVYGVQFHPEKSGEIGLRVLENFYKKIV